MTPTCEAPRHDMWMRRVIFFFFFFSPNVQRARGQWGGWGGGAARLFLFNFFPCSADHERDWPPCKVVFFGLATNVLNVKNNNNSTKCLTGKRGLDGKNMLFE